MFITYIIQYLVSVLDFVSSVLYSMGDWFYANSLLTMAIVVALSIIAWAILAIESRLTE